MILSGVYMNLEKIFVEEIHELMTASSSLRDTI